MPPRTLRLGPSRSAIPAGQHDPFGAGAIAIARGLRLSGSRGVVITKTWGPSRGFVSDKRPKFTAKTRSSPSLRTRKEAPGAGQPIVNRKNGGTVPGFLFSNRVSQPAQAVGRFK
jgi:hypothetical protein